MLWPTTMVNTFNFFIRIQKIFLNVSQGSSGFGIFLSLRIILAYFKNILILANFLNWRDLTCSYNMLKKFLKIRIFQNLMSLGTHLRFFLYSYKKNECSMMTGRFGVLTHGLSVYRVCFFKNHIFAFNTVTFT